MELADAYVALTDVFIQKTALSHPMAHLHIGLFIYVGVQFLLRTRRASSIALQAVYGAEIVNEILEWAHYGSWRVEDTLTDLAMTVFWPTVLYATAKYRRARWEMKMVKRQLRIERERSLAYATVPEAGRVPQPGLPLH